MYRLTNVMIENFESYLEKFHDLLKAGRCEAWQLEELIVRAIKSDHETSNKVTWNARGHDIHKDIMIEDKSGAVFNIQVKSGKPGKKQIVVSGHRLGRFEKNLNEITNFLNKNDYDTWLIPFYIVENDNDKYFKYKLLYVPPKILKIDANWVEKKGKEVPKAFLRKMSTA